MDEKEKTFLFILRHSYFLCTFATENQHRLFRHIIVTPNVMSQQDPTHTLTRTVEALSDPESLRGLFHQHQEGNPLPSGKTLEEIMEISRAILFPGYYGVPSVNIHTLQYQIGVYVERLRRLLIEQIHAGLCFASGNGDEKPAPSAVPPCDDHARAEAMASQLIARLPEIRRLLATDVVAAYNGDPAAESYGEIISCYPAIKALSNYRVAHELYVLGVPLIPRMLTELSHSETGIDIHPAAQIGSYFTIDHGTGVVIGATCIIGSHVKLYQGVTLGAKSFPVDEQGNPIKGIPRHPILEDNVIVYSNATILGRITIGEGCVVGANIWVTEDMEPKTKKYKRE